MKRSHSSLFAVPKTAYEQMSKDVGRNTVPSLRFELLQAGQRPKSNERKELLVSKVCELRLGRGEKANTNDETIASSSASASAEGPPPSPPHTASRCRTDLDIEKEAEKADREFERIVERADREFERVGALGRAMRHEAGDMPPRTRVGDRHGPSIDQMLIDMDQGPNMNEQMLFVEGDESPNIDQMLINMDQGGDVD